MGNILSCQKCPVLEQRIGILETENLALHANIATLEEELAQFKPGKFVGKWKRLDDAHWDEYKGQFGHGFLFSILWGTQLVSFEVDGDNWKFGQTTSSRPLTQFELGKEFDWVKGGYKHKVIFNFEHGKLVGKETRVNDEKVSKHEVFIDPAGNLVFIIESGGVVMIDKFSKVLE